MSAHCPTCGQVIPEALSSNGLRLLEILRMRNLDVYETVLPGKWGVTFSKGILFSEQTVRKLVQQGHLVPTYPDTDTIYKARP